ncbi:MAG: hypothetical protein ACYDAY_11635 [Candidatus Dormibacteria bacterium]
MKRNILVVSACLGLMALGLGGTQASASDPGPHGCVLGDANGTAAPTVYPNSGTSQIGGNFCTYTQVAGVNGTDGGYVASAQAWSIVSCVPVSQTECDSDAAHSYSSAAGSLPVGGAGSIPAGDLVTVSVSNGTIVAGTPDGA